MPFSSRMGMYLSRMGNTAMGQGTIVWTLETVAASNLVSTQPAIGNGKASTASASFVWRSSTAKSALSSTIATRATWASAISEGLTKPLSSTLAAWSPLLPGELLHGTFAVILRQFGGARSAGSTSSTTAALLPHGGRGQNITSKAASAHTVAPAASPSRVPQWLLRAYTASINTTQTSSLTKGFAAATRQWNGTASISISRALAAAWQTCAAAIAFVTNSGIASPFTALMGSTKSRMANTVMGQNTQTTAWFVSTMATLQAGTAKIRQTLNSFLSATLPQASPSPTGVTQKSAAAQLQPATAKAQTTVLAAVVAGLRRWLVATTAAASGTLSASTRATARTMNTSSSRVVSATTRALLGAWPTSSVKLLRVAIIAVFSPFRPIAAGTARLSAFAQTVRMAGTRAVANTGALLFAATATARTATNRQVSILRSAALGYGAAALSRSIGMTNAAMLWFSGVLPRAISKMVARAKLGPSDGFPTSETSGIANLKTFAKLIPFRPAPQRQVQSGTAAQTATGATASEPSRFGRFANAVLSLFRAAVSAVRQAQPAVRIFIATYQQRLWLIVDEAVILTTKDPAAIEDFELDWTIQLGGVDFINSSSWSVNPLGLTITEESSTETTSTARLAGGTMNTVYDVANTVNLASGQVKVRHLLITIQEA